MTTVPVNNSFGAPVYFKDTVTSTMDEARSLVDIQHGAVLCADYQTTGRGRNGRYWQTSNAESLSFTVTLRYAAISAIPSCLTLRMGLAVSGAIEDFAAFIRKETTSDQLQMVRGTCCCLSGGRFRKLQESPLAGKVLVKWPNDVMLLDKDGQGRKAVGILTETESGTVYAGIGVNIAQRSFSPELAGKAYSIAQALSWTTDQPDAITAVLAEKRFILLELILSRLYNELETSAGEDWRKRLNERLYMKGRRVCFISGLPEELADPSSKIEGILQGIGEKGEILIEQDSGEVRSFVNGELRPETLAEY